MGECVWWGSSPVQERWRVAWQRHQEGNPKTSGCMARQAHGRFAAGAWQLPEQGQRHGRLADRLTGGVLQQLRPPPAEWCEPRRAAARQQRGSIKAPPGRSPPGTPRMAVST